MKKLVLLSMSFGLVLTLFNHEAIAQDPPACFEFCDPLICDPCPEGQCWSLDTNPESCIDDPDAEDDGNGIGQVGGPAFFDCDFDFECIENGSPPKCIDRTELDDFESLFCDGSGPSNGEGGGKVGKAAWGFDLCQCRVGITSRSTGNRIRTIVEKEWFFFTCVASCNLKCNNIALSINQAGTDELAQVESKKCF